MTLSPLIGILYKSFKQLPFLSYEVYNFISFASGIATSCFMFFAPVFLSRAFVSPQSLKSCLLYVRFSEPLSAIACLNRPFACFATRRSETSAPPADSPNMVTLLGSPPNWLMFCFTHFSPWIRSSTPRCVLSLYLLAPGTPLKSTNPMSPTL